MAKKLDAKDVELFLLENTDFFVSRESIVSELSFKHDTKGATSLLEMQVRKLRDEQSRLMDMLSGFLSTGKENEELFFKSKNLTLSMIASKDFNEVKKTVETFFVKNFNVDVCILEIIFRVDLSFIFKLATAAEAEPQDKVSPAPASFVLSSIIFAFFAYKEIFTFLKKLFFLNFFDSSSN